MPAPGAAAAAPYRAGWPACAARPASGAGGALRRRKCRMPAQGSTSPRPAAKPARPARAQAGTPAQGASTGAEASAPRAPSTHSIHTPLSRSSTTEALAAMALSPLCRKATARYTSPPTTAPGSRAFRPMAWKYQRSADRQGIAAPSHCTSARQRRADTMLDASASASPARSHNGCACRSRCHSCERSASTTTPSKRPRPSSPRSRALWARLMPAGRQVGRLQGLRRPVGRARARKTGAAPAFVVDADQHLAHQTGHDRAAAPSAAASRP